MEKERQINRKRESEGSRHREKDRERQIGRDREGKRILLECVEHKQSYCWAFCLLSDYS